MTVRGRKPTPTHLKVVTGNPGKRALNKREPKPSGNLYDAPEGLTEAQKASWNYAIECSPHGLLKRIDSSTLRIWVVAEDLHRQATNKLNDGALLIKTPNGAIQQSPLIGIINRQAQIMLKAAAEMGFTPASRSRIEIDNGPQEDDEHDFYG